nr:hypothetical protein [Victivallis sp. Marseille-Q1083]
MPSYSPDLNPDEYPNRELKSNLSNKPLGRAKGKITEHAKQHTEHAKQHMEMIAEQPERIKKLFHSKTVLYAS